MSQSGFARATLAAGVEKLISTLALNFPFEGFRSFVTQLTINCAAAAAAATKRTLPGS